MVGLEIPFPMLRIYMVFSSLAIGYRYELREDGLIVSYLLFPERRRTPVIPCEETILVAEKEGQETFGKIEERQGKQGIAS